MQVNQVAFRNGRIYNANGHMVGFFVEQTGELVLRGVDEIFTVSSIDEAKQVIADHFDSIISL